MKNNFYKLFSIISFLFLLFFVFNDALAVQLVPACGEGTSISDRCTLCHLFDGIKNIIDWGRDILAIVAVVAIVAGGIMYIVSAGDEKMMSSAKGIIKQALWGVLIVLGAWVIVNTAMFVLGANVGLVATGATWYDFSCDKTVYSARTSPGSVLISSVRPDNSGNCPTGYHLSSSGSLCVEDTPAVPVSSISTNPQAETDIRNTLATSGISINRPNACTNADHTGCTDVGGLRQTSIDGVINFKNNCGANCNVVITGGSEGYGIHSESGTYNHINGYKVDIRPSAEVDSYITNNFTQIPQPRSDGAIGYRDSSGNTYYKEGDHWDVTYYR